MSEIQLNFTTIEPILPSSQSSNKDILLVVASVSMVVATVILIVVVKVIEKCIPSDKPVPENLEKKRERVNMILEKHTKQLTYAEWILAERLKHQQTSTVEEMRAVSQELVSEPAPAAGPDAERASSAMEISQRLASAPKEEEVWATDCAVCLAEFGEEEQVRELACEHIFHHDCIHDWFMKAKAPACPLCRNLLHSGISTDNVYGRTEAIEAPPHTAEVETV